MSAGLVAGVVALGLAFAIVAIRQRHLTWAFVAAASFGIVWIQVAGSSLDLAQVFATTDDLIVTVGLLAIAVTTLLNLGLPAAVHDRVFYGAVAPAVTFDRTLRAMRRPFVDAATTAGSVVLAETAKWRSRLTTPPPSPRWTSVVSRLSNGDEQWAANVAAGLPREDWLEWAAATDQAMAEWHELVRTEVEPGLARARRVARLARFGDGIAGVLVIAGLLNLTNGLFSAPPSGRAGNVPAAPIGRSVHLLPLGDFATSDLQALADFYAERYDLHVNVLSPLRIPGFARNEARNQLTAELLIAAMPVDVAEAKDRGAVVIGVTSQDLYIQGRPDWAWAFGLRTERDLAVLSTARMGAFGPFGHQLEAARFRKMVTKYIGAMYFDLPESDDWRSPMFGNILSAGDLDRMREDF